MQYPDILEFQAKPFLWTATTSFSGEAFMFTLRSVAIIDSTHGMHVM